jgi:predicted deacylase
MYQGIASQIKPSNTPLTVLCSRGYWLYTKTGGVLEVYPKVNSIIKKGALIARIKNIFGNIVDEVFCPETSVVTSNTYIGYW